MLESAFRRISPCGQPVQPDQKSGKTKVPSAHEKGFQFRCDGTDIWMVEKNRQKRGRVFAFPSEPLEHFQGRKFEIARLSPFRHDGRLDRVNVINRPGVRAVPVNRLVKRYFRRRANGRRDRILSGRREGDEIRDRQFTLVLPAGGDPDAVLRSYRQVPRGTGHPAVFIKFSGMEDQLVFRRQRETSPQKSAGCP